MSPGQLSHGPGEYRRGFCQYLALAIVVAMG